MRLVLAFAAAALVTAPAFADPAAKPTPKPKPSPAAKPAPAIPTVSQVIVDGLNKCHWAAGTGHTGFVKCPAGLDKAATEPKTYKDKAGRCQYVAGQSVKGFAPKEACK